MLKSLPELIIFDCDGVLVDSEMISSRVFANILCRAGLQMTPEEAFLQFKGGSIGQSMAYVEKVLGGPPPFDIEGAYRKESFEAYQNEMEAVEGIPEMLDKLTIPICVGSNGPRNKILLNLQLTRLDHHFDDRAIFSAYDFQKWKPDPTMFLEAAKSRNIAPEKSLVVGDSIADVLAAKNAGIPCIGFAPHGDNEGLAKNGAKVIRHMDQLANFLFY